MSNLVAHAKRELKIAGYAEDSADALDRVIYQSTIQIVEAFARCGHSGYSAMAHTQIINQLLQFKPLGEITNNPDEWFDHGSAGLGEPIWQNKRDSRMFSEDEGQTYYSVDEFRRGWKRKLFGARGKTYTSKPSGSY